MASSTEDPASQEAENLDLGVNAESPVANETPAEPTMLDAVTAALEGKEGPEVSATSNSGEAEAKPKAEAEGEKSQEPEPVLTEQELQRLSIRAQKRFRSLVKEREKADAQVADLSPKAQAYDLITEQIRGTGLDQSDLTVTFDIATALKRGDAFQARALIQPIWDAVNRATGGVLPHDLVADIQGGKITVERAQELAVARAAGAQASQQGRLSRERQDATAAQQLRDGAVNSVNEWEKSKAASDPDWKLKAPEIQRSLELSLLRGQRPKTSAEAVQMAETALKEVNERLRQYRPAPRAVRAVVSSGGAPQRNTDAAPKNTLDIIRSITG